MNPSHSQSTNLLPWQPALPPSLAPFPDDESRWQAVKSRSALADGAFVYAVRTTKIYCRPICKARLARRANVRFYEDGGEATKGGFRACKRCKPEEGGWMREDEAVRKIWEFVAIQDGKDGGGRGKQMSLGEMARVTGLSKWHFHRVFKKCVGVTPFEYARKRREMEKTEAMDANGYRYDNGDMDWAGGFDMEELGLGSLDGSLGSESLGKNGSGSTSRRGCSPLSFEDLVIWPGE